MKKVMRAEKRISNQTGKNIHAEKQWGGKQEACFWKYPEAEPSGLFLSLLLFSCFWVKAGTIERFSSSECLGHCSTLENCFDRVRKDRLVEKNKCKEDAAIATLHKSVDKGLK